jgi:hypothetical protein
MRRLRFSVATTAALAAFFLSYLSVFAEPTATTPLTTLPEGAPGHRAAELPAIAGLASYLATTAAVLVPLLALRRIRPSLPPGAVIAAVAAVALLGSVLTEFRHVVPALGAVLGAAVLEASRPAWPARWSPWLVVGVALPAVTWAGQLAGLAVTEGVAWTVELWAGVVVVTALAGAALALLTGPAGQQTRLPGQAPAVQGRQPAHPDRGPPARRRHPHRPTPQPARRRDRAAARRRYPTAPLGSGHRVGAAT